MRLIKVENGIVIDSIVCSIDEAPEGNWIVTPNDWVGVGLPVDMPEPQPPKSPLAPVSPRQIRMALTRIDLRTAVETAVAAGNQDLKDWWEFSTQFERKNAQVEIMATVLGVSSEQLDQLWNLAATL